MIIDFHAHIFPADLRNDRQNYFASEAAFKLLYSSPKAKMIGAKELVNAMDAEGIDKTVVFGFPWQNAEHFQRHNDYVLEAVNRFPDRLIGFGCFDPLHSNAARETARCLEGGLSGIGELAFYESGFEDNALEKLAPVMEICRAKNVPVTMHTNEPVGHDYPGKTPNTLAQIYQMVKKFNNNKIPPRKMIHETTLRNNSSFTLKCRSFANHTAITRNGADINIILAISSFMVPWLI